MPENLLFNFVHFCTLFSFVISCTNPNFAAEIITNQQKLSYNMKIIVNRGIDKLYTKIVILKNSKKIAVCPFIVDHCIFDTKEGDKIEVKLKLLDTSTITIASFVCNVVGETCYVSPSMMYKRWELVNFKVLPFFCTLFFLIQLISKSNVYEWCFTIMLVITVLSLICSQLCSIIPSTRNKIYKLEYL